MFENTKNLTHKLKNESGIAQEAQVYVAQRDLEKLNHGSSWGVSNAAKCGIRHRRRRVFISTGSRAHFQDHPPETFQQWTKACEILPFVDLKELFSTSAGRSKSLTISDRMKLEAALASQKCKDAYEANPEADIYVALMNSIGRSAAAPEIGIGEVPCLRPNSRVYSVRLG